MKFPIHLPALLFAVTLAACGDDVPSPWYAQPSEQLANIGTPVALLDTQLAGSPPAGVGTTLVTGLRADAQSGETRLAVRLRRLERLRYCIPDDEPAAASVRLEAADGSVAWEHVRGAPCPDAKLIAAGDYAVVVAHRGGAAPALFVHEEVREAPLQAVQALAAGTPPGEYWMLQHVATGAYLNHRPTDGPDERRELLSGRNIGFSNTRQFTISRGTVGGMQHDLLRSRVYPGMMAAWSASEPVRFMPDGGVGALPLDAAQIRSGSVALAATGPRTGALCYVQGGSGNPDQGFGARKTICLGLGTDSLVRPYSADPARNYAPKDPAGLLADPGLFRVNPRHLLDASGYVPREGEVVLFVKWSPQLFPGATPNSAFVFDADAMIPDPSFRPFRVRLGPNTAVSLDGGKTAITENGELTWPGVSGEPGASSVQVVPARTVLIESRACVGCDLTGLNLSWRDLSGVDLRRAVLRGVDATSTDFRGANLKNANLTGANLHGANFGSDAERRTVLNEAIFDDANLSFASFAGTSLACVQARGARMPYADFRGASMQCVDMSGSALGGARFDPNLRLPGAGRPRVGGASADPATWALPGVSWQECRADAYTDSVPAADGSFDTIACGGVKLPGARVWPSAPPASGWKYMDLTGAVVRDAGDNPPIGANMSGIDFSGGLYAGVDFGGTVLRGANFDRADLTGANLSRADLSCVRNGVVEAPCASLRAAVLRGANLTYANAKRADFSGAFLSADPGAPAGTPSRRAANLSYLYGPNSAFDGTDLTGVMFANAQIYGTTRLTGTLVRADFSGAVLSGVDFTRAKLQGARFVNTNLVNANFENAEFGAADSGELTTFSGAMLQGAKLRQVQASSTDFTGATLSFSPGTIDVTREIAPGRIGTVRVGFCATIRPASTDTSTTCPIGTQGACTPAQWQASLVRQPQCVPSATEPCPVSTDLTPIVFQPLQADPLLTCAAP